MMKQLSGMIGGLLLATTAFSQTTTLNYTGGMQTYTVPAGATGVEIHAYGAQGSAGSVGGNSNAGGAGGTGGYASGKLTVPAGTVLNVFVGGQGTIPTGGFNGGADGGAQNAGGGGGATDIRLSGTALTDRILVAGGGGGGGRGGCESAAAGGNGGAGGGLSGSNGVDAPTSGGVAGAGFGAVGQNGGAAGAGCASFLGTDGAAANGAIGGVGGDGQACCCFNAQSIPAGGGGGGGYLGGGGGGGGSAGTTSCSGNDKGGGGGGAGGTSYVGGVTDGIMVNGVNVGNGYVEITPIFTTSDDTLFYTGGVQYYQVPPCVYSIRIEAWGGSGADGASNSGAGSIGGVGGAGGYASGTLAVTPGEILTVVVGGAASGSTGGYNGGGNGGSTGTSPAGGGGGASNVIYLANDIVIAGGGGGGGAAGCESALVAGGAGGIGGNGPGSNGVDAPTSGGNAGGGFGAIGANGGAAGVGCGGFLGLPGANSSGFMGGNGGGGQSCCCFTFPSVPNGGGGGGGFVGGGGGGGGSAGTVSCSGNDKGGGGGGAGGSSNVDASLANPSILDGVRAGDGLVVITPDYNWGLSMTTAPTAVCEGGQATFVANSNHNDYVWTAVNATITSGQGSNTVNVDFSTLGAASVSVQAVNACGDVSDMVTVPVTVNTLPVVTMDVASIMPLCENADPVSLTGGLPAGGSYSGTGVMGTDFDPAAAGPGTHTISYTFTDGNGCSNTDAGDVIVNPLPTVTLDLSSFGTLCANGGAAVTLTGGLPAGGNYTGFAVAGGMFDPVAAGVGMHSIGYEFTDANGCMNTAFADMEVSICGGVTIAKDANDAVTVFPTPAKDVLNVRWTTVAKQATLRLFDSQGKLILQTELDNVQQATLDVSSLINGAYLLSIDRDGVVSSQYISVSR